MTSPQITLQEYKTANGKAYRANISGDIPSEGTMNLHLRNLQSEETAIAITAIKHGCRGPYTIRRPIGETIDSDGTPSSVNNKLIGDGGTEANVDAFKDSTYSGEDEYTEELYGSLDSQRGNSSNAFGGDAVDELAEVEAGEDLVIEIVNDDTADSHGGHITIEFYEKPQ